MSTHNCALHMPLRFFLNLLPMLKAHVIASRFVHRASVSSSLGAIISQWIEVHMCLYPYIQKENSSRLDLGVLYVQLLLGLAETQLCPDHWPNWFHHSCHGLSALPVDGFEIISRKSKIAATARKSRLHGWRILRIRTALMRYSAMLHTYMGARDGPQGFSYIPVRWRNGKTDNSRYTYIRRNILFRLARPPPESSGWTTLSLTLPFMAK